jgi:hypothetical protein
LDLRYGDGFFSWPPPGYLFRAPKFPYVLYRKFLLPELMGRSVLLCLYCPDVCIGVVLTQNDGFILFISRKYRILGTEIEEGNAGRVLVGEKLLRTVY